MLVQHCMTRDPAVVSPHEPLTVAHEKMTAGSFRHLPVVHEGVLVGILTDRDLYRRGVNEQAQVKVAMTQEPVTVSLVTPVERAALLMVHHRISGLPVLKDGSLVGIITATDLLKAVAEMTAVAADDCIRVNLLDKGSLVEAAQLINRLGGTLIGMGRYTEPADQRPVCFLRLRGVDGTIAAEQLRSEGYTVLSVH